MLKYFLNSKSQPQLLLLLSLGIIINIFLGMKPPIIHSGPSDGVIYTSILFLFGKNYFISRILARIIFIGSGFLLNELFKRYSIFPRRNFLLLLIWLIIGFSFPSIWDLNPQLIAFMLLIYSFYLLFESASGDLQSKDLITISLMFSIASLIYKPFIAYVFFLPLALLVLRQLNFKFIFISITLYSIPYLFFWVYLLYFGNPESIAQLFHLEVILPNSNVRILKDYHNTIPLILVGLLFVFSLIKSFGNMAKKLIHIRIIAYLMIAYFIFTLILISILPADNLFNFYLLFAPITGIIAMGIMELKSTWILDIYLLIYIIISILLLYF